MIELVSNRAERTVAGATFAVAPAGPGDLAATGGEPADQAGTGRGPGGRGTDVAAFHRAPAGPHRTLTVVSARPLPPPGGRPGSRWLVELSGVHDRPGAEALRGVVLLAPALVDDEALWVHQLVGSAVVDGQGTSLGTVVAVVANPASDLLELADGALVPLRFVTRHSPGRVEVDVPAGLLD